MASRITGTTAEKLETYRLLLPALRAAAERRRLGLPAADKFDRFAGDPVAFVREGLGQCRTDSWWGWMVVLKAAYGLPLDDKELMFFREVSGGRQPPARRVKELWLLIGRRAGKDSFASMIAVQAARYANTTMMRPGEVALVACLAGDRDQAGIVHRYIRGYFETVPELRSWVTSNLDAARAPITLANHTEIRITTNNFRAPRGYAIVAAIFDECAFWRDNTSATPDIETYRAVRPGMTTIPGSMLIGITTVYRKKGLVYDKWREHFGVNDDDVLVIQAESTKFHPTMDRSEMEKGLREDPEAAAAEWLSKWREDLADYVDREIVESLVDKGRREAEPVIGRRYFAFADPSGGSRDSFALAIGHFDRATNKGALDYIGEWRAPFQPRRVVEEQHPHLKRYGVGKVVGDAYAGEWVKEAYREVGIVYETSELVKNDIYREFLPLLNSRRVSLLDNPRMIGQICGLERRTMRGGRESIDHPDRPNVHDDLANVCAGVLVNVAGKDIVGRWLKAYAA